MVKRLKKPFGEPDRFPALLTTDRVVMRSNPATEHKLLLVNQQK